jgi:hypothetical protein
MASPGGNAAGGSFISTIKEGLLKRTGSKGREQAYPPSLRTSYKSLRRPSPLALGYERISRDAALAA